MDFWIQILLIFGTIHITGASLVNRVDLPCETIPVPQWLPDSSFGSYCRFNGSYAQIDIAILIDLTADLNETNVIKLQQILVKNLNIFHGKYDNDTIDIALVGASNISHELVKFGTITNFDELANSFNNISTWMKQYGSDNLNFTNAFSILNGLFNHTNGRPKMVIVITEILNQYTDVTAYEPIAEAMKANGVKIYSIGYSHADQNENHTIFNSYLSSICTYGWYSIISLNDQPNQLFNNYSNFVRQAACQCLSGTTQFSILLPTSNWLTGSWIQEFYADCLFNLNGTFDPFQHLFEYAADSCQYNFTVNARLAAINSTMKSYFVKDFLQTGDPMNYWTGLNGSWWSPYNGSYLPVDQIPDDNDASRKICLTELGIANGTGGIMAAYNDGYLFCSADQKTRYLPLCESKAVDSLDNWRLCKGPFINADTRPAQLGAECSSNLFTLWLDLIIVVDVSKNVGADELDLASKSLMDSLKQLNMNIKSKHSTRISLITFASLPKLQMKFEQVKNASQLGQYLSLSKYRNPFDAGRNAESAFALAKTMLLSQSSYRRSAIIFVSSGFKQSDNPEPAAKIMKKLFDTAIITISTNANTPAVDNLATLGFNLQLDNELSNNFKAALTQANCYCQKDQIQFVHTDAATNKSTYFAECFYGSSTTSKTIDQAFDSCAKKQATPVIVTHPAKAEFLIKYVIPSEIDNSPAFSLGLKRHYENSNMHFWHEYKKDGYTYGSFPPKLLAFDDTSLNCTMGVIIEKTKLATLPTDCNVHKMPYICQTKAKDANNL